MKLFRLVNPHPGWDRYESFLIRAISENEARKIASFKDGWDGWLDSDLVTCEKINVNGETEIVLSDFVRG